MSRTTTGLCFLLMLVMVSVSTPFAAQNPATPHAVIWRDPGDMASLPKGAVTRWHLTLPFKEMWVLAGA